ncbi:MAG: hypothetical protein HYX27_25910 [Acidobacteria bacterium]|nr:hypothetical protein [Acidobacteriota bacterium]
MRLKSYFVHTMEEALQTAKVELGEDAMLVDSKRLETPQGGRARLEVIFAAPVPPPALRPSRNEAATNKRAATTAEMQRFRGELTALLESLRRKPDASLLGPSTPAAAELDGLLARLLRAEVPAASADEVVEQCRPVFEGLLLQGSKNFEDAVVPLLAAEWPQAPKVVAAKQRVLAFAGPTGAGKTSAIAKLAFLLGVSQGKQVFVISIDNLRIGATDQLAHLCSLLGVPFQSLEYTGRLPAAVTANSHRGLILIDTPGYGQGDADLMAETAGNLVRVDGLVCHLVLPATLRYNEMQRQRQHFAPFAPSRVLFTRLDETEFFGPAWAFARNNRLAADWASTGPGIPEDIQDADATSMASALLGRASAAPRTTTPLASAASAGTSGN